MLLVWSCASCEGSGRQVVISLYNLQLWCVSGKLLADFNLWTGDAVYSTLCSVYVRSLPAWRRLPSLLCIWLQGSGSKRGSHEAGSGRLGLMKRSVLLSGGLGEVSLVSLGSRTLCLHPRDAGLLRWFRWGGSVSLKDSLTEVDEADGLTLAATDDLWASGRILQSTKTNNRTLKYYRMIINLVFNEEFKTLQDKITF